MDSITNTNTTPNNVPYKLPIVDLNHPQAHKQIVRASKHFGFFKLVNHGVSFNSMMNLEILTTNFFNLPQSEKNKAGPANPYGYGNKTIGRKGDIGWLEYLLFDTNSQIVFENNSLLMFRPAVASYLMETKRTSCKVLELIAGGLGLEPKNVLSRLLKDEKSDSVFRINHYPPCPEHLLRSSHNNLIGFGEHTDPQIISVLRSNDTAGLQIFKDGTWIAVPADPSSLFVSVGDILQVMTNGQFQSVKHRVVVEETTKSRISMIYFGGPSLHEKITPLPSLLEEGEESLYTEFTWLEYKNSAYKSRLSDNRLGHFERST